MKKCFDSDLKEKYTVAEATEEINRLLAPYGDTCKITFREFDAEIIDSCLVKSKRLRHRVCKIICRTGLTKRTFENLSAEWVLHNAAYALHVYPVYAKDVSLDYNKDPRFLIAFFSDILDFFNIE